MPPKLTTLLAIVVLTTFPALRCTAADQKSMDVGDSRIVKHLIEQLDSDKFGDRQLAANQLRSLGERAIADLAKATHSDSQEVSGRAFEILQQHLLGNDTHLELAAKATLQSLAEGDSIQVADKAKRVLESSSGSNEWANPFGIGGRIVGRPIIAGAQVQGRIQIQIGGINNARQLGRTVKIHFNNGIKSVEMTENNKTTKVAEQADGSIEVTEIVAGNAAPKQTYKNADELKKQNPAAHKIFQQGGKPPRVIVPPLNPVPSSTRRS